jgi:opacity protein-like surface antigen
MQPYSRIRSCAALFLLGATLFLSQNLRAQTPDAAAPSAATPSFLRYGLFGGVAVNNHVANFTDFADFIAEPSPMQGGFGATNGAVSYYFGGLVEIPLVQRLGVALRASITNVGGFTLVGKENLGQPSPIGSGLYVLQISHTLTINNLQMLSGEPYLTYRILDGLTLYAGARFGYMLASSYSYKQKIPDDSPVRYFQQNGQPATEYDVRSGAIPQLNSLNTAISGGASLEIPIDHQGHWFVAVEAFYMYGLTQVANGLVLRRPLATNNGLSVTRTVPTSELGTERDPASAAWPSEIVAGSWLFNNLRAGISLRYAP